MDTGGTGSIRQRDWQSNMLFFVHKARSNAMGPESENPTRCIDR